MKSVFVFCTLLATFVCLQAAPPGRLETAWYDLLRGTTLEKGRVGDIWSDCSKPGDHAKISGVTITPDPPVAGQQIEVQAKIDLDEEVTGGEVKVSLKYGIVPIYSSTMDLCDLVQQLTSMSCPLAKGVHDIDVKQTIPGDAPSGHYTGNAVATDQNGAELACIDVDFQL